MKKALALIGGAGVGAGIMYFLDPDRGRRRRALVRDKVAHEVNQAVRATGRTRRDLGNRLKGLLAEAGSLFEAEELNDSLIVERVRAKIGRVASHPHLISVISKAGEVVISGLALTSEIEDVVSAAAAVRGVINVRNELKSRETEAELLGLKEGAAPATKRGSRPSNWTPTARLLTGAAGGALVAYAASKRSVPGMAAGTIGLGLVARAVANTNLGTILGVGSDRSPIYLEKTMSIDAPLEEVFDFWVHHENFPSFMPGVLEVKDQGEGQYHWRVAGPAGVTFEWDGKITELVPFKLVAWETLPGSAIRQKGRVKFQPGEDENSTRIDVKMGYYPPAGAIGHALAELLGADPTHEIEEGLQGMKSLIETGRIPKEVARRAVPGTP